MSDANFIKAMQIAFNELAALCEDGAEKEKKSTGGVDKAQVEAWRAHLEDKKDMDGYSHMLKTIIHTKFVKCKDSQVLIVGMRINVRSKLLHHLSSRHACRW